MTGAVRPVPHGVPALDRTSHHDVPDKYEQDQDEQVDDGMIAVLEVETSSRRGQH